MKSQPLQFQFKMDSGEISRKPFFKLVRLWYWNIYEKCKIWGPNNTDNVSRNVFSGLLDFDFEMDSINVSRQSFLLLARVWFWNIYKKCEIWNFSSKWTLVIWRRCFYYQLEFDIETCEIWGLNALSNIAIVYFEDNAC